MSEGLELLHTIGAQKIHEQTHITRQHTQALIHNTFDDMTRVQFLGFISILEREYSLDLSELKASGEEFYSSKDDAKENQKIFVIAKKKKKNKFIYIVIVLIILILAISFTLDLSSIASQKVNSHSIDNATIEIAKEKIEENITQEKETVDKNQTLKDINSTVLVTEEPETTEVEVVKSEVPEIIKSFKIIPKTRLWLGYIDLSSYKKYQKTTKDEIILDSGKEWLILLGHNNVELEVNGKIQKFQSKYNVRLLYKDSTLSKITIEEFKKLNRGKKW